MQLVARYLGARAWEMNPGLLSEVYGNMAKKSTAVLVFLLVVCGYIGNFHYEG